MNKTAAACYNPFI